MKTKISKESQVSEANTASTDVYTPNLCPICKQDNMCGNINSCDDNESCWCNSPEIKFPQTLLNKIDKDALGKSCICKTCALAMIE